MADNIFRIVLGVLVGAWVARYLGPNQFGELAYALAFVAFFQTVSKLGLDSVVIRDLAKDPNAASITLGTVFRLRLVMGFTVWAVAIGAMALLRPGDATSLLLVAIVAGTVVFQAADTIDLWFQSCTQSKRTVMAKTGSTILVTLIRVILILAKAPLIAFAAVMVTEAALTALGLFWVYNRYPTRASWSWNTRRARQLVRESWPFLLSSISVIIYMRIDQIMLREMVGEYELGIYSAALPLSTVWYFIPMAISSSVGPMIARAKNSSEIIYNAHLERLFSLMWWYSLPLCLCIAMLSEQLITCLYGPAYSASAVVLAVHVFANVPVALGVAQSQWIVNEGHSTFALYRTQLGMISNVLLNLILIPTHGAVGAAVATVIGQIMAAILSNLFFEPRMFVRQIRCLVHYA
ncbi:MAG: flippase [Gammaproteobacteria bacterium]|nr:flippase [Gammaproteobacteria bacterium]